MNTKKLKDLINGQLAEAMSPNRVTNILLDARNHVVLDFTEGYTMKDLDLLRATYPSMTIDEAKQNLIYTHMPVTRRTYDKAQEKEAIATLMDSDTYFRASFTNPLEDRDRMMSNIDNDFTLLMGTSIDQSAKVAELKLDLEDIREQAMRYKSRLEETDKELRRVSQERDDALTAYAEVEREYHETHKAVLDQQSRIETLTRMLQEVHKYHTDEAYRMEKDGQIDRLAGTLLTYDEFLMIQVAKLIK